MRFEPGSFCLDKVPHLSKKVRDKAATFVRWCGVALVLIAAGLLLPLQAHAQADFTLQASQFNPYAIDPGGNSLSTVTLGTLNGFNGTVDLSCTVTPATSTAPGCEVSPAQVAPPASASLTVTGTNATSGMSAAPGSYTVTVTGTAGSTTHQQNLAITVLAVAPGFTITVQSGVVPSSVHAGSGGQAVININPLNGYALNGQGQGVWLSCATVTPLVTLPPVCSFDPQPAPVNGTVTPVTLTINTTAAARASRQVESRRFYGAWLFIPIVGMVGLCAATNKRSRNAWGLLAVFVFGGIVLLMPACGNKSNSTTTTTTTTGTPKNAYTFTITGVDTNGTVSTNTGTTSSAPTVTLTVN